MNSYFFLVYYTNIGISVIRKYKSFQACEQLIAISRLLNKVEEQNIEESAFSEDPQGPFLRDQGNLCDFIRSIMELCTRVRDSLEIFISVEKYPERSTELNHNFLNCSCLYLHITIEEQKHH